MKRLLIITAFISLLCLPTMAQATPCSDAADEMVDQVVADNKNFNNQVVVLTTMDDMTTTGLTIVAPGPDGKPRMFDMNKLGASMTEEQLNKLDGLLNAVENEAGVQVTSKTETKDAVATSDTVKGVATTNAQSPAAKNLSNFLNSL